MKKNNFKVGDYIKDYHGTYTDYGIIIGIKDKGYRKEYTILRYYTQGIGYTGINGGTYKTFLDLFKKEKKEITRKDKIQFYQCFNNQINKHKTSIKGLQQQRDNIKEQHKGFIF